MTDSADSCFDIIVKLTMFFVVTLILCANAYVAGVDWERQRAVEHGVAYYVIDEAGRETKFIYRDFDERR